MDLKNVAIVGATGAVGVEILRLLDERKFPVGKLELWARASDGRSFNFRGQKIPIKPLAEADFANTQIAIFSVGSDISSQFAPIAAQTGCIVVDNSSAFRMDDDVPLVVPEINATEIKNAKRGIIANPNCTTAITLMALWPLHQRFGVTRIIASSYQAVSGSGQKGIEELRQQIQATVMDQPVIAKVYSKQIAFNVIPRIGKLQDSGYTDEEEKMQCEGRKIMNHPTFVASTTCVRVPVYRSHSVSVTAECEREVDVAEAIRVLQSAPGVKVIDDRVLATPLDASGSGDSLVSRIRKDNAFANGISFWVTGDQLLKGAALNAVQIAERLV